MKPLQSMMLPLFLSVLPWLPMWSVYTYPSDSVVAFTQLNVMFKQTKTFKHSEIQALNIKLDFGTSPEPQRLSSREKIALKLTQITKTTTN